MIEIILTALKILDILLSFKYLNPGIKIKAMSIGNLSSRSKVLLLNRAQKFTP